MPVSSGPVGSGTIGAADNLRNPLRRPAGAAQVALSRARAVLLQGRRK